MSWPTWAGSAALVRFYDAVDDGAPVDAALRSSFGLDLRRLHRPVAGPAARRGGVTVR